MTLIRRQPLATQVASILRQRLCTEYADGGRLPGEKEIAAELGVSRGTVRQALSMLEQEGVVSRRQGDGTYVNRQVLNIPARIEMAYEFTELIRASGHEAQIRLVGTESGEASARLADRLEVQPGAPLLKIGKVFLADGEPAIYCVDCIPIDAVCEPIEQVDFGRPVFDVLASCCHLTVDYVLAEIFSAVATAELARLLAIQEGEALLRLDETYYTKENRPVMWSRIHYRDSLVRLAVLRKKA